MILIVTRSGMGLSNSNYYLVGSRFQQLKKLDLKNEIDCYPIGSGFQKLKLLSGRVQVLEKGEVKLLSGRVQALVTWDYGLLLSGRIQSSQ